MLAHILGRFLQRAIQAVSAGAALHHLLDGSFGVGRKRFGSQQPQNNLFFVDHHANFLANSLKAVSHRANPVGEVAGGDTWPGQVTGVLHRCILAFYGPTVGQPIYLARGITENLAKAQTFKPPRGPGAQVSLVVVAVDDDRPVWPQLCCCLAIQLR